MKLKPLSVAGIALFLFHTLSAQIDTSTLDAGNFKMLSRFTQHTTISGSQLEKFPFSSLDEAINVYFNGAYTNRNNIVYVVDGNMGADINAYSAHDILSVTLVSDARTVENGARNGRQLILVETKTGFTKRSGITVALSEHLVHDSATSFFHNVYGSGRYYKKNVELGGSFNYLHEAFPIASALASPKGTLNRYNRYSVNGWANVAFGKSVLTVRVSMLPTDSSRKNTYNEPDVSYTEKGRSHTLNIYPSASLKSQIGQRWYNEITAAYFGYVTKTKLDGDLMSISWPGKIFMQSRNRQSEFTFREQIGFVSHAGQWTINPSLNATGRLQQLRSKDEMYVNYGTGTAASISQSRRKQNELLISPNANFSYGDVLNVQAGVQYRTGYLTNKSKANQNLYPFGAVAVDAIKLFDRSSRISLMLHGSYARYKSDLSNYVDIPMHVYILQGGVVVDTIIGGENFGVSYHPYNAIDAGVTLKLPNNFTVLYTLDKQSYYINLLETANTPGFPTYLFFSESAVKYSSHKIAINYTTSADKALLYTGSLSAIHMQSSLDYSASTLFKEATYKEQYPRGGWSGGFANAVQYKYISAGLNAIYFFDEHDWVIERPLMEPARQVLHKKNSFLLQHVYFGYQVKKKINLYISGRNLLGSSDPSFINGNRKYFGAGMKAEF